MKCDLCNRAATVHLTEIRSGRKIEKHLCEQCATKIENMPLKSHTPINQLLTNFVLAHSGAAEEAVASCEACGMTWAEFRQKGLLGCPRDYDTFERDLAPLIQRAHDGAARHVGKSPARVTDGMALQRHEAALARLRKDLTRAVEAEDYEKAAKLRDQIREMEQPPAADGRSSPGAEGAESKGGAA
jgi:protein arginine kinase activator